MTGNDYLFVPGEDFAVFEESLRTLRFIRLDHTKNRCRKWGGVVLEMVGDHPRIKLHQLRTPFPNTFLTRFFLTCLIFLGSSPNTINGYFFAKKRKGGRK